MILSKVKQIATVLCNGKEPFRWRLLSPSRATKREEDNGRQTGKTVELLLPVTVTQLHCLLTHRVLGSIANEQFWHGQGCPFFDVVRPAFPLLTTASPTL